MWNNQADYDNYDNSGGYMNTQGGSQPETSKKAFKKNNIIPCSIGRLLTAEQVDDTFVSNGAELNQLSLVGLVVKAEEAENSHLYLVTDMSGPAIEIRDFVDEESSSTHQPLIQVNTYVHVCGNLRSFGNKRSLTAFMVRPLTDLNQLTSHLFECMHAQVYKNKLQENGNRGSNPPLNGNMAGGDLDMGLSKIQSQVLKYIKNCVEEHGVTIPEICNQLKGLPKKQISDAVDFLSNEGHIYSTIDDDHYKATDLES